MPETPKFKAPHEGELDAWAKKAKSACFCLSQLCLCTAWCSQQRFPLVSNRRGLHFEAFACIGNELLDSCWHLRRGGGAAFLSKAPRLCLFSYFTLLWNVIIPSSGWKEQHKCLPSGDRRFQNCSACKDNSFPYPFSRCCHRSPCVHGAFRRGSSKMQRCVLFQPCSRQSDSSAGSFLWILNEERKQEMRFLSFQSHTVRISLLW